MQKEDPLFLTLNGEKVHAVFINEAAYYEKGFAMYLSKKKMIEMPEY